MTIIFSDLVKLYRRADFDKESGLASYCIESDDELRLVKTLAREESFEYTRINVFKGTLEVGQTVELEIRQPKPQLGWLYQTFDEFVKGDFYRILSSNSISTKPYYIKDIDYYSEDLEKSPVMVMYDAVQRLLYRLEPMSAYLDATNRILIFICNHTFELDYDVSQNVGDFKEVLNSYANNSEDKLTVINSFCEWLEDELSSKHVNEKKSILAFVLFDMLPDSRQLSFLDVISNISFINKSVRGQYALYLENFKYEKFVKKLEENGEKFINRVNDSISKVLSQILALPIAATVPTILRNSGTSGELTVYVALLAYAVICYFALDTQKSILDNIEEDVNAFDQRDKVPTSLYEQWRVEKSKILSLINKQNHLYWIMFLITCVVIFYAGYQLVDSLYALKTSYEN